MGFTDELMFGGGVPTRALENDGRTLLGTVEIPEDQPRKEGATFLGTVDIPHIPKLPKKEGATFLGEVDVTDVFKKLSGTSRGWDVGTTLSKAEEADFKDWYGLWADKFGLNPNPDDSRHFYDYRGAFKAGATPNAEGHWPSQFKREGHPNLIVHGVNTKSGEQVEPPSFVRDVVYPTINDFAGVIPKVGAGLIHGGTMGIVDPERGKIGIPFTDVKFKYAPPLGESLESLGMTPELAQNPYIGIGPSMIGIGKPWGAISKFLSKAIMARRAGQTAKSLATGLEAAPKPLSAIERIGLQTGVGGAVGAAFPREEEESILENALNTAAIGGGLQALGEGIAAIARATGIGKANAYLNLKKELSDIFCEKAFSEKLGRTISRAEADAAAELAIDKGLVTAGIEKPSWKDLWTAWRRLKGRRGMPPPTAEPAEPTWAGTPAGEPPITGGPDLGPAPPGPIVGGQPIDPAPIAPAGPGPIIPPIRPIPGRIPGAPLLLPPEAEIPPEMPPASAAIVPPAGEQPPGVRVAPGEEIGAPGANVGAKPEVYYNVRFDSTKNRYEILPEKTPYTNTAQFDPETGRTYTGITHSEIYEAVQKNEKRLLSDAGVSGFLDKDGSMMTRDLKGKVDIELGATKELPKPTKLPYGRAGNAEFKKIAERANFTPDMGGDYRDLVSYFDKHYNQGLAGKLEITGDIHPGDAKRAYQAGIKDRETANQKPIPGAASPEAIRQKAIDRYTSHLQKVSSTAGWPESHAAEVVSLIDNKDQIGLRQWMNGINPEINKLFTALTGLPAKTQKDADASLRSFDPEKWDAWQVEKKVVGETKAAERETKRLEDETNRILDERVRYNGQEELTRRELYRRLVDEGYSGIEQRKKGAVPENWMVHPDGRQIKVPKGVVSHIQGLMDAAKRVVPEPDKVIKEAKDAGHTDEEISNALAEGEKAGNIEGAAKPVEAIQAEVQALAKELGVSFAPEILVQGSWSRNGLRFATEQEAADWGVDRLQRWMMAEDSRVVPANEPPNWIWKDGELQEITAAKAAKPIPVAKAPLDNAIKEDIINPKGGVDNERPGDGSTGERPLEESQPGGVSAHGEGQGPGGGERGGRPANAAGNERADVAEENGTGGLAGEPAPIHIPDEGETGGELPPAVEDQTTPASEPRTPTLSGDNPGNYRITPADDIGSGTRGQKIDGNLAAIRLVKQLEQQKRYPTKAEQATLAKYVGWGGLKSVFDKTSTKPQDIRAREEIERLLTKEEYLSMFLTITDAHYTSPEIIASMYDVLRHMGFEGGNVLEPTYGAGNFLGLMPEDMSASSKWYGSELDPITARIGQSLYPESQLIESGFQVAEFPFGKFDLAIGNPPFGDLRIADTKKSRAAINRFKIHNYVIAKEGMHLKPGGVLANVVTTRFLDTADPEARDFLAQNFRFLGAIRLPNDAFAKNAGTTVTTDIIFLQRLMPDEKPDLNADWLTTGATMENSARETIALNKYFAERPHMMLGEPSMKGTMYGGAWKEGGKGEFTLEKRDGQDTGALIKDVIENYMNDLKGIVKERANDKADAAALSFTVNKEDVGIGGFYVDGGKVYMRGDDDQYDNPTFEVLTPATQWTEKTPLGQKRYDRIVGMLELRAKAYKLIEAERFDTDNIEALRKDLNRSYDAFVKEHGFLSEPANFGLMSDDIKIEFGLETGYKKEITPTRAKVLGIKPTPAVAEKASLLKKRLFYPSKEIIFAKDVTDGYGISLSQRGRLDIDYISSLTGKTAEEVTAELSDLGLAFKDPETGKWIQEDEYLSGNVKAKHKLAVENGMDKNAAALKNVFPTDKGPENIFAGIGATWIPEEIYKAFGQFIGIPSPAVMISHDTGKVFMSGGSQQNDVNVAWQNEDYDVSSMFNAAAGHKTLIAYDGSGDDRTVNKERTKGISVIVKQLKNTFDDWLMADDTRSKIIVKKYNDTQNTHARRKFDGKHLRTVGASPAVELRRTQGNAAWRMIQSPIVMLDHAVGSGKTFTIITGIEERARMGLTRKAIIAVPNHLVGQWAADWLKLYPGAKILAATNKDFSKPNRRRLFSRITTGSFDAVIVGHSSFGFIPIEKETIRNLVEEEIAHLIRAQADAQKAGEKRMVANLAKRIQKKRERIVELMNKPRDNVSHFEQMGIDHIVVDESHEFKNLEYSSSMQNVTGMGNPSGSKRAFDLYSKIRWLSTQKGTGVTFATGTPISNSLVEMYAILRYLNRQGLVDRQLEAFDAWAGAYATTENKIEYTASQKLKDRVIMSTFRNVRELVQLFEEFADSVTMEDLKKSYSEQIQESNRLTGRKDREVFPVPKVVTGGRQLDLGDADDAQRKYVDYLVARANRLEDLGRENDPKIDNHLWLMSDARKMALDIRLVDPTTKAGKNNKINRAAKQIKRIYDQWQADKGTQLVFCDLSTPAKTAQKEAREFIRAASKIAKVDKNDAIQNTLKGMGSFQEQWGYLRNLIDAEIDAISESKQAETAAYIQRREALETFLEEKATDSELASLATADSGFSVYDDLKAKLIRLGIPAGEIRFIHEANSAAQKDELFGLVNSGAVRILIGSTPKMGAGTNAQERMVALHHMDAPWRPSDVEQREGRLVRQGNALYERDPEGFEVSIYAYSTGNTFDAVMWQILARKQEMLNDFRSGKDTIDDRSNDSASYADFMAETTGNPAFKEKFKLEGEIEELAATMRRIHTRRQSAEQSLQYNADRREDRKRDIERYTLVDDKLKKVESQNFTYQGKEYVNDIQEMADKEHSRIEAINDAEAKRHDPIKRKVSDAVIKKFPEVFNEDGSRKEGIERDSKEFLEAKDYYDKELKKAGIEEYPKKISYDRDKLAKQYPGSALAAAVKIRKDVNNLPKEDGGEVSYSLDDVKVTIKVNNAGTKDKEGNNLGKADYKWFVDDLYVEGLFDKDGLPFDTIHDFLSVDKVRNLVYKKLLENRDRIANMDYDDKKSRQTLDKLQFKDEEKLKAKQARYAQVVQEVNTLEAEIEARRSTEKNKYIEADTDRFGSDYVPAERRRVQAEPEDKPSAEEMKALRDQANQAWDDYQGGEDHPVWLAGVARAKAILARFGEGDIKTAQDRLNDAKESWDTDYEGEPYPPEFETVQKIITGIRQGQQRLFKGGKYGLYDTGGYADFGRTAPPQPKTEAERNAYIANPRIYLELPEIVEFASRAMDGKFPQVRRFMGMALGRFYPGTGKITIINNMDLDTLAKVLAHEVGHLADWLPDKDMAKGNILGRIGSIPGYLKSLLEEYPGAPGKVLTTADRERLRKEAAKQMKGAMTDGDIVTYITRTVPKYEEVGITPEMILNLLKGLTNEPKNVLDFLKSVDGKVKGEIAKQAFKNLVDERLRDMVGRRIVGTETITEEVRRKRETKPERIAARYQELLREEIEKRRFYEKEVIIGELKALTQKWKPFTPGADSYTKYRFSSKELYADAVSVLFNDPELLRQTAPTFWKAFFNYFERKPELQAIYDELQARRANPDQVLEQRREFTRDMAEEGAQLRARNAELLRSRNQLTPSRLWHAVRMALGDQNIRAQEMMEAARKAGRVVPDKERIDYWVEELPYINSEIYGFRRSIEKDILAPADEAGISLIDLHEYMILKRAATERAGIYNPGGIGDRFADQQLDFMRRNLGDDKFGKVKALVEKFQAEYKRQVTEVVKDADFLPADLIKTMMENPNYATFANLEYMIEQRLGKGTSARIYKQYGMLGKVDNVFVQTVLKGMALIRAARHHQTKMALINSPDVGTVARARRGHKGVGWQQPKDPDMGIIVMSPGGQPQAYYIDKELAQLWEHNDDKANAVQQVGLAALGVMKGILGRIFIAWNPGWIVANPPRDFWATWKKVHEASGSLTRGAIATFVDAVQAGMGKFPERERRMLAERKIIPGRFYDDPGTFGAMERGFLGEINDPVIYQNKVIAPLMKAWRWMVDHQNWFVIPRITHGLEVIGKIGERWGKFAADEAIRLQAAKKGRPIPAKRTAHLVRTRAGTPNSLSQGTLYWLTESFFPFSNVALQDLRSSTDAFREGKGSYAWKTAVSNILPKLIFAAMVAGFFGDDMKKAAGKVGKYFRRMYINLPLAVMDDGNVINLTIPQDYTGQTVSALTDAMISGDWSGSMATLGILFENQPYNINPFLMSASDWVNYYALNQRPNDSFTGNPSMPEDIAKVGGTRAFTHMARQTWNRFFGTMLYRIQADRIEGVENELKTTLGIIPFNTLGRFIRVTNTGDVEKDMQTVSDIVKQETRARLTLREEKIHDINAREGKATPADIIMLYRKQVDEGNIDPLSTSLQAFAKSYMTMELSKGKNTFVKAITLATSDQQKAALMLRWKGELSTKEYEDLKKYLIGNSLIGKGVGMQMLMQDLRQRYPAKKSVIDLLKAGRGQ